MMVADDVIYSTTNSSNLESIQLQTPAQESINYNAKSKSTGQERRDLIQVRPPT